MSLALRIVALVCFLLAAITAVGLGTVVHPELWIPLGLAAWVTSTLVP